MFVSERKTLYDLVAGLTRPCQCNVVAWTLSSLCQV